MYTGISILRSWRRMESLVLCHQEHSTGQRLVLSVRYLGGSMKQYQL